MLAGQLALVLAAAFAGAALFVNIAEQPARLALDDKSALIEWQRSYDRAAPMQAGLALVTSLLGFWVAWQTRDWRWLAGAWLLTRLFTRNEYTRHDAPLSVRRAYTADEVVAMARQVGLRPVARYSAFPGYRYALVFVAD